MLNYLANTTHTSWRSHYADISISVVHTEWNSEKCKIEHGPEKPLINANALIFTREWKDKLPAEDDNLCLRVELIDTTDGKTYDVHMPAHYASGFDLGEQSIWHLDPAFYSSEFCPCARKQAAKVCGATITDTTCDGTRFMIYAISLSDACAYTPYQAILYSEIIEQGELELILHAPCN